MKKRRNYPHLLEEDRPAIPTGQAAHYLCRKPRTLRDWANNSEGAPIRPVRINGRLAWPVAEIKRALGVA